MLVKGAATPHGTYRKNGLTWDNHFFGGKLIKTQLNKTKKKKGMEEIIMLTHIKNKKVSRIRTPKVFLKWRVSSQDDFLRYTRGGKKCVTRKATYLELYVGCTEEKQQDGLNHRFLLGCQFPYVCDQPLAVVLMVNWLHIHHCGLDPRFILSRQYETTVLNFVYN